MQLSLISSFTEPPSFEGCRLTRYDPRIALLSLVGGGIAPRSRDGWFPGQSVPAVEPYARLSSPLLAKVGSSSSVLKVCDYLVASVLGGASLIQGNRVNVLTSSTSQTTSPAASM